jgi:hypothetical protein
MQEGGFDIDLSYICKDRIIVMSYPATGIKKIWRNNQVEVKRFLDERHPNHYYVFNVSEKPYSHELFDGRVKDYNW